MFPSEVSFFWNRQLSLTSVLFFLNRYIWLVLAPFSAWTLFVDFSDKVWALLLNAIPAGCVSLMGIVLDVCDPMPLDNENYAKRYWNHWRCVAINNLRQLLPVIAHTVIACMCICGPRPRRLTYFTYCLGVFVTRLYALYQRSGGIIAFCAVIAGIIIPFVVVSHELLFIFRLYVTITILIMQWITKFSLNSVTLTGVGCNVIPDSKAWAFSLVSVHGRK